MTALRKLALEGMLGVVSLKQTMTTNKLSSALTVVFAIEKLESVLVHLVTLARRVVAQNAPTSAVVMAVARACMRWPCLLASSTKMHGTLT